MEPPAPPATGDPDWPLAITRPELENVPPTTKRRAPPPCPSETSTSVPLFPRAEPLPVATGSRIDPNGSSTGSDTAAYIWFVAVIT